MCCSCSTQPHPVIRNKQYELNAVGVEQVCCVAPTAELLPAGRGAAGTGTDYLLLLLLLLLLLAPCLHGDETSSSGRGRPKIENAFVFVFDFIFAFGRLVGDTGWFSA
jgi:hypothetical protein